MDQIRVIYHDDSPECWWAESPEIPRWTAVADTLAAVRQLAEEGVRYALERDDVRVIHLVPASA